MKTEGSRQANTRTEELARNADGAGLGVEIDVPARLRTKAEFGRESGLMEPVCERGNLMLAYQRVIVVNPIKEFLQVHVNYYPAAFCNILPGRLDRLKSVLPRPKAVA